MAITHSTAAKQASTNAITALVDAGTGAGYFTICDGSTVLATITFSDPAFATADADGTAAADTTPALSAAASADGTADNFKVYDSDDTLIFSGVVTTTAVGTGDMQLDNTNITTGQTVTISSFTYDAGEA